MTRVEFLNSLYSRLGALQQSQAEEWLVYYAEMLADRMEEGMTEEEAVASMESIDVIAGRILQEAGLPPEMVTPPAYPSPPPMGGGGTRAYTPPRKGNALNAFLWVLAGIAVVFAVGRWAFGHLPFRSSSFVPDGGLSVDAVQVQPGMAYAFGFEPIPDYGEFYVQTQDECTVQFYPVWEDRWGTTEYAADYVTVISRWTDRDAADRCSYEVAGWTMDERDGYQISTYDGYLEGISIQWQSGSVTVECWDYDVVAFEEVCTGGRLSDGDRMTYEIFGGQLTINETAASNASYTQNKSLRIVVPKWWISRIDIRTASADVTVLEGSSGTLRIQTASGDVQLGEISVDTLVVSTSSGTVTGVVNYVWTGDVSTISGDIDLEIRATDELALGSTSGDVFLRLMDVTASGVNMETTSGDITLIVPEYSGFGLQWKTTSGTVQSSLPSLYQTGDGRYIYGDEYMEIAATTTSGSLYLKLSR